MSTEIVSVAVRLKRGIARSSIESRLEELSGLIQEEILRGKVYNWRAFMISQQEADFEQVIVENLQVLPAFSTLISAIVFGSLTANDGEMLKFTEKLDHQLFHIYCPSQDEAFSQDLSLDGEKDGSVLSFVLSLIRMSTRGVNTKIINVNRLLLLLGPPGTGKTSLCLALAQQLSICLRSKGFPRSILIEINTHSLFSKWFSESGKLVMKMFDQIDEAAEDEKTFVFVLIDEVESLGISRTGSVSRSDPADSIRAVNALLTQIDRIRRRQNVFIMCTSNLRECLDSALVDRADLIRVVPPPGLQAVTRIILDCINELKRVDLLKIDDESIFMSQLEEYLPRLVGMSGRSLRKIPALIYTNSFTEVLSGSNFLTSLGAVIEKQAKHQTDRI
ncbi:unnamed protein product, partial [Mesorhabditis belari]|uniref:AAA+ ATPase domain-containing protein n=1 Tax=Mesorhabditis belari TaxID=2138241 RepID=A0AAF3J3T4_9BILA